MSTCLLTQLVVSILQNPCLRLLVGKTGLDVGSEFDLEFFDGDLMVGHNLELLCELNGLIE
jgi:hypothetical protein